MTEPMQPRLKTNQDGSRTLYVFYCGDNFDQAIEKAERRLNLLGNHEVTVIALPMSRKFNDFN